MATYTIKRALFAITFSVIVIGCVKEAEQQPQEQNSENLHEVVFHAGWAPETKTVLQEDGSVWWSPWDEISLFVEGNEDAGGFKFTSTITEPASTAEFIGQISDSNTKYTAIYPYNEDNCVFSDGRIQITIPTRQIAKEGTFADGALVSIAVSEDRNLYFRNVCSGIKFSVANEGIQEVEFAVINDFRFWHLSGVFLLDKDGNYNVVNGSYKVSVIAPDGQCFAPGKYYYVTIPALELWNGLSITYRKETTEATLFLNNTVSFEKSVFKRLYNKDAGLEFHNAPKHATIPDFASMLPNGLDNNRSKITEVHFYISTDKTTETILDSSPDETSEPIYFELKGTVANYYTKAEVYKVLSAGSLFSEWTSLQHLDLSMFDVSSCTDFGGMFQMCYALKDIQFGDFDITNAKRLCNMFDKCVSLESIALSRFNTSNVQDMNYMFYDCRALKELDLSNFDTHNVMEMGGLFWGCYSLEKLDISSFTSDRLDYAAGLFSWCTSLLKLNMGSFNLSSLSNNFYTCHKLASRSRNCAILCTPSTKEVLLSFDAHLSTCESYVQWFLPGDVLPDLSIINDPALYYSTDYSQDKKVKLLNVATEGNGVNVVIMGEAYTDRLIADGTYERDMVDAMNQLFSVEPLKSFKHLFNVYMVNAVSENEVLEKDGGFTTFKYHYYDGGEKIDCDDFAINDYLYEAVGQRRGREDTEVTTLIVVNDYSGNGVAMVVGGGYSTGEHYDYPAKIAGVAFVCKSLNSEPFHYTTCHEFGHAFAALHDEYIRYSGEMEEWESESKKNSQSILGWWPNVSFTSDPSQVSWRRFMEEGSGYGEDEVSIIEGAYYSHGIWRSVSNSMMSMGGEYSVPAREAMYKRIHKLAYGDNWQYSFEDFVNWDRGIFASTQQATKSYPRTMVSSFEHPKPFFKMEESISNDGKRTVRVIMN